MKAKPFNPLPAFALDLALAMMKAEVRKPVVARPATTPRLPDEVLILRRKLGVTEFPPKLTVLVRGQRWFDPSGRELDQKIYREYYHCPDTHTPRFGRIAGHTRAPKPLASNWPKPEQAHATARMLWFVEDV